MANNCREGYGLFARATVPRETFMTHKTKNAVAEVDLLFGVTHRRRNSD